MAYTACALVSGDWKGGEEHTWCGDTGAHSMVASMAAAAIDGSVFATPLLSG